MIGATNGSAKNGFASGVLQSVAVKRARTILGYIALGVGVTAGGTLVGATIVAPVVAHASADAHTELRAESAGRSAEHPLELTTIDASDDGIVSNIEENLSAIRTSIKHSTLLRNVPNVVWLYVGIAAAAITAAMIGWRLRERSAIAASASGAPDKRSTAALPVKLMGGRSASRTPRAVVALAEAGNAPADIARRTGLSLDAVVMCLSLSSIAARQ